jgi:hypothetical protein
LVPLLPHAAIAACPISNETGQPEQWVHSAKNDLTTTRL